MDFLQSLLDNSSVPVITAFILGILTAISPCPLATNITAIGFIGKDIENRHRIFINGLLYTFGRIVTYTALGGILIPVLREGASMYMVQKAVSKYGEMLIAPVLILVGIFMLDIIKLNIPKINIGGEGLKKKTKGSWGVLLLGILFALAFCPTSGVFYFGIESVAYIDVERSSRTGYLRIGRQGCHAVSGNIYFGHDGYIALLCIFYNFPDIFCCVISSVTQGVGRQLRFPLPPITYAGRSPCTDGGESGQ